MPRAFTLRQRGCTAKRPRRRHSHRHCAGTTWAPSSVLGAARLWQTPSTCILPPCRQVGRKCSSAAGEGRGRRGEPGGGGGRGGAQPTTRDSPGSNHLLPSPGALAGPAPSLRGRDTRLLLPRLLTRQTADARPATCRRAQRIGRDSRARAQRRLSPLPGPRRAPAGGHISESRSVRRAVPQGPTSTCPEFALFFQLVQLLPLRLRLAERRPPSGASRAPRLRPA